MSNAWGVGWSGVGVLDGKTRSETGHCRLISACLTAGNTTVVVWQLPATLFGQ